MSPTLGHSPRRGEAAAVYRLGSNNQGPQARQAAANTKAGEGYDQPGPDTSLKACCEVLNPEGHSTIQECEEAGESHPGGAGTINQMGTARQWDSLRGEDVYKEKQLSSKMAAAELQKAKAQQRTQLTVQRLLEAEADSCQNNPAHKVQQSCQTQCLPDKRTGTTEEQRVRSLSMLPSGKTLGKKDGRV